MKGTCGARHATIDKMPPGYHGILGYTQSFYPEKGQFDLILARCCPLSTRNPDFREQGKQAFIRRWEFLTRVGPYLPLTTTGPLVKVFLEDNISRIEEENDMEMFDELVPGKAGAIFLSHDGQTIISGKKINCFKPFLSYPILNIFPVLKRVDYDSWIRCPVVVPLAAPEVIEKNIDALIEIIDICKSDPELGGMVKFLQGISQEEDASWINSVLRDITLFFFLEKHILKNGGLVDNEAQQYFESVTFSLTEEDAAVAARVRGALSPLLTIPIHPAEVADVLVVRGNVEKKDKFSHWNTLYREAREELGERHPFCQYFLQPDPGPYKDLVIPGLPPQWVRVYFIKVSENVDLTNLPGSSEAFSWEEIPYTTIFPPD